MPTPPRPNQTILIEQDGVVKSLSPETFEKITGAAFIPQLDFDDFSVFSEIVKKNEKLHAKGRLSREQLWLGSYFRNEILTFPVPDVVLRYIDPVLGWGVFAARDFKKMEFIAEYSGKLRKRRRLDRKNAYCFEYILAPDVATPFTIDSRDQGGISRYINHSFTPNLLSTLATLDHVSHVILVTNRPIAKGEQLCYDYGSDYWACRTAPQAITASFRE